MCYLGVVRAGREVRREGGCLRFGRICGSVCGLADRLRDGLAGNVGGKAGRHTGRQVYGSLGSMEGPL